MIYYAINFWDDNELITERGFASREENDKTVGDIINRVFEFYGRDNIESVAFYECENIICEEEVYNVIKNAKFDFSSKS